MARPHLEYFIQMRSPHSIHERRGPVVAYPEEGHRNDPRDGAPLLREQERAWLCCPIPVVVLPHPGPCPPAVRRGAAGCPRALRPAAG